MTIPMFRITDYLDYLVYFTNHHGVHSPFLYSYLTQCLYRGPWHYPCRAVGIATKSVPYFGIESIGFFPEGTESAQILLATHPELYKNKPPFDMLFLENPEPGLFDFSAGNEPVYHNNTLCIIENIRGGSEQRQKWEAVKSNGCVRMTVDAFSCGLVFFRKELSRQDFKIRI